MARLAVARSVVLVVLLLVSTATADTCTEQRALDDDDHQDASVRGRVLPALRPHHHVREQQVGDGLHHDGLDRWNDTLFDGPPSIDGAVVLEHTGSILLLRAVCNDWVYYCHADCLHCCMLPGSVATPSPTPSPKEALPSSSRTHHPRGLRHPPTRTPSRSPTPISTTFVWSGSSMVIWLGLHLPRLWHGHPLCRRHFMRRLFHDWHGRRC